MTITVPYEGADPETVETEVTDVDRGGGQHDQRHQVAAYREHRGHLRRCSSSSSWRKTSTSSARKSATRWPAIRGDLPHGDRAADRREVRPRLVADHVDRVVGPRFDPRADTIRRRRRSRRRIESVPGVGSVRMVGDREREVRIWLRVDDLRAHGLSAQDVHRRVCATRTSNRPAAAWKRAPRDHRQDQGQDRNRSRTSTSWSSPTAKRHADPPARRGLGRRRNGGLPQPGPV